MALVAVHHRGALPVTQPLAAFDFLGPLTDVLLARQDASGASATVAFAGELGHDPLVQPEVFAFDPVLSDPPVYRLGADAQFALCGVSFLVIGSGLHFIHSKVSIQGQCSIVLRLRRRLRRSLPWAYICAFDGRNALLYRAALRATLRLSAEALRAIYLAIERRHSRLRVSW
jgi:hypothetical protein